MGLWSRLSGKKSSRQPRRKKIPATKYYKDLGYVECPECDMSWHLDEEPVILKGSDILIDECPKCGAHILVNNLLQEPFVYVESFSSEAEVHARMMALSTQIRRS